MYTPAHHCVHPLLYSALLSSTFIHVQVIKTLKLWVHRTSALHRSTRRVEETRRVTDRIIRLVACRLDTYTTRTGWVYGCSVVHVNAQIFIRIAICRMLPNRKMESNYFLSHLFNVLLFPCPFYVGKAVYILILRLVRHRAVQNNTRILEKTSTVGDGSSDCCVGRVVSANMNLE